jgi:hypothetical protein
VCAWRLYNTQFIPHDKVGVATGDWGAAVHRTSPSFMHTLMVQHRASPDLHVRALLAENQGAVAGEPDVVAGEYRTPVRDG